MADMNRKIGCWLATPDVVFIELAARMGYGTLVLDVEHGTFDLKDLDRLLPLARALGMETLVKVEGPRAEPIQQALDFGATGVIIPHIGDVAHAEAICRSAKYPLLGTRSYAGARSVHYDAPDDGYFDRDNSQTRCLPMIETAEALADVEAILALPQVDGVFVGPSDLSLSSGRGRYRFGPEDRADITRIAKACEAAGKPWTMPAWSSAEQEFASALGASVLVVIEQQSTMATELAKTMKEMQRLLE